MGPQRRAVIDVGTNSVKLLVAEVDGHTLEPILEQSEQTRLGTGFYQTRQLQPEAVADTARAVAAFAAVARHQGAASIRVVATSAAREAHNRAGLIDAIRRSSGLTLEIISGEQEADYVFRGVTCGPERYHQSVLILDVGGGSTEFILGAAAQPCFRRSFPVGTVRLLETFPPADPPAAADLKRCQDWLREII